MLASGNRQITADLPLVANLVCGWHKLGQTSVSRILDDIRRKPCWNLGTKAEILERFAANSVPLLHKTMMLLALKEEICAILEEWTKEPHHRGEIAAGWVCGSGLRSFRTRAITGAKVFLDAG